MKAENITLMELQSKLPDMIEEHKHCSIVGHKVCVVDGDIVILHREDIQKIKRKCHIIASLSLSECSDGMTARAWRIFFQDTIAAIKTVT